MAETGSNYNPEREKAQNPLAKFTDREVFHALAGFDERKFDQYLDQGIDHHGMIGEEDTAMPVNLSTLIKERDRRLNPPVLEPQVSTSSGESTPLPKKKKYHRKGIYHPYDGSGLNAAINRNGVIRGNSKR